MTAEEIYNFVKTNKPSLVYLSGKTSTGKSTFANKLVQDFGYKVVELDQIVKSAVIQRFNLTNEGTTFVEVYRGRDKMLWIEEFVKAARNLIEKHLNNGELLVIEGAVAHPITLSEVLAGYPDFMFVYFHPQTVDNYIRNLTQRFMQTNEQENAALPAAFWKLIDQTEFKSFCKSRIITKSLSQSIREYAKLSQEESNKRLREFKNNFRDIKIVEI